MSDADTNCKITGENSLSVNISLDEEDLTESEIKIKLFIASAIKIIFLIMFMGSIMAFPYEIIMDNSFGLSKAFLLVFWGMTCLIFGSGVATSQKNLRWRLKELRATDATAPKTP